MLHLSYRVIHEGSHKSLNRLFLQILHFFLNYSLIKDKTGDLFKKRKKPAARHGGPGLQFQYSGYRHADLCEFEINIVGSRL